MFVVGTDGSPRALAAVRFGAVEADRHDGRLVVTHVLPHNIPMLSELPLRTGDLEAVGRHLLAEAAWEARHTVPGVEVASRLLRGRVAGELVGVAAGARLVAVGRESSSVRWRVFTGAVTFGVAARAPCPVVSVPARWQPGRGSSGSVAVGFRSATQDGSLLDHAVDAAATRGATLTVLHAWEIPSRYDELIAGGGHDADWNLSALEHIEAQLTRLREDHPWVEIDVRVVHRQAAQALREASRTSDLLILGRRGAGPAPFHLGDTARAVLREAVCPVVVVPSQGGPSPPAGGS
jgi:nucleotide-binding universal stress UspA family protein